MKKLLILVFTLTCLNSMLYAQTDTSKNVIIIRNFSSFAIPESITTGTWSSDCIHYMSVYVPHVSDTYGLIFWQCNDTLYSSLKIHCDTMELIRLLLVQHDDLQKELYSTQLAMDKFIVSL